ncbi:MAG: hypothetical protein ABSC47_03185 [Terracidiphilus sp.]
MRSSRTITLFTERLEVSQSPSSFLLSILAHGVVIGLVSLGILYAPGKNPRILTEHYPVRRLELNASEAQMRGSAGSGIAYPGPYAAAHAPAPGGKQTPPPAALRRVAQGAPGKQTLVQPNLHSQLKPAQEIPVPTTVIWSPEKIPAKNIVPPKPELITAADAQPLLDPPNEEMNLADLGISATDLASQKQAIPPSTTSPVVVHGPERVQMVPVTTSESSAQPTPAAVMSLSDLRMKEGTVTLPPMNETASSASPGALAPGQGEAKEPAQAGNGNTAGKGDKSDKGNKGGKGDKPDSTAAAGNRNGSAAQQEGGAGTRKGTKTGPAQGAGAGSGSGSGNLPGTDTIKLPIDGQFGVVVVGSSMEDKYPETAELWSGRLAYTVYLHVGLTRSWVLQYSLSRAGDAAAAGNIARLEAPWPYNIVRPNISPGAIDADALMVHGFVNQAGRFEALSIAYPPEFAQAKFVLDALAQWQFRPAAQNGQNVRVEVLLVIPQGPE